MEFFKGVIPWLELVTMWVFQDFKCRNDCFLIIWIEKKILEQNSELLKKCRKSPFLTGVSPWFCSKNRTFYHVCFSGKPRKIRSLFNILDREEYFLDQKGKFQKMSPNLDFSKGVSPCSCQNIELFTMWVFQAAQCGKDCFLILWIEKNTFQTKKVKFPKRPKNRVFQRGKSMFLSKNQGCYHVVFLGREGKKDRFLIFRIEKDTFQSRKVKFQKRPKNQIF